MHCNQSWSFYVAALWHENTLHRNSQQVYVPLRPNLPQKGRWIVGSSHIRLKGENAGWGAVKITSTGRIKWKVSFFKIEVSSVVGIYQSCISYHIISFHILSMTFQLWVLPVVILEPNQLFGSPKLKPSKCLISFWNAKNHFKNWKS